MFSTKKISIFITALAFLGVIQGNPEKMKKLMESPEAKKCAEASGQDLNEKGFGPPNNCFLKCMLEEKGKVNENGDVNPDVVDDSPFPIPDDKIDEIKRCVEQQKVKQCEDMEKLFACAMPPHH